MSPRLCKRPACRGPISDLLRSDAVYCSEACSKADRRDQRAKRRSGPESPDKARTRRPGGVTVSYPRAVRSMTGVLAEVGVPDPEAVATRGLRGALSPAGLARVESGAAA